MSSSISGLGQVWNSLKARIALCIVGMALSFAFLETASAADTRAPTAPTDLVATAESSTRIELSWTASTDNVGVTRYRVERCTGAACTDFTQVANPTGTTYSDTGRSASTTYRYRVRARDAANNWSGYSRIASATTLATDTRPPTAPGNLTAAAVSASQIDLNWTASTDNVGVTGYRVERCAGAGCTNFKQIATSVFARFSDIGLSAATEYRYRVRAKDAANNISGYSNIAGASTQSAGDTAAPSAPGDVAVTAVSTTQLTLSWGASADNVGVTGYQVERCPNAGCTGFTQVATVASTNYNDTALSPATTYGYRIRALDAAGNLSAYSAVSYGATQYGGPITYHYSYDPLGHISTATGSDGSSIAYQYDANGNVIAIARQ